MNTYDWSRFVTRIPVRASVETLYSAWATRKGIEAWFLRMSDYKDEQGKTRGGAEQVNAGNTYAWRWYGWPDEVEEHGVILSCNGKDAFAFSFGDAGICHVRIKEEDGETIVELEQSEIPTDEKGKHYWHLGCKTGWTFYLANLKSIMEGGIDLRNKNESIKNVVSS